jgi:hypothetical protein
MFDTGKKDDDKKFATMKIHHKSFFYQFQEKIGGKMDEIFPEKNEEFLRIFFSLRKFLESFSRSNSS